MQTNFLFIDETINSDLPYPLSSLTALLVPSDKYDNLRTGFYEFMRHFFNPEENKYDFHPPELHFNNFLPDSNDDEKFRVVEELVNLLVKLDIRIYRIAYFSTPLLKKDFKADPDLFGLCWIGMQFITTEIRKNNLLIPVMDAGFERSFQRIVDSMSQPCRSLDMMRTTPMNDLLSIYYSENLGEPMYVDSKYSAFIQLTDCVAGLRKINDTKNLMGIDTLSKYKQKMLSISLKLDDIVSKEDIIEMNYGGTKQGPSLKTKNNV